MLPSSNQRPGLELPRRSQREKLQQRMETRHTHTQVYPWDFHNVANVEIVCWDHVVVFELRLGLIAATLELHLMDEEPGGMEPGGGGAWRNP